MNIPKAKQVDKKGYEGSASPNAPKIVSSTGKGPLDSTKQSQKPNAFGVKGLGFKRVDSGY